MAISGPRSWGLCLNDASAGVQARSYFVEFLRSLGTSAPRLAAAELIFGELLGNVVRHAPGPVEISIDLEDESLVLHVTDSGPPLVVTEYRLPEEILSERGRGLFIVAQLATDVCVDVKAGGNRISVTMTR